jgi:hypothetical protein
MIVPNTESSRIKWHTQDIWPVQAVSICRFAGFKQAGFAGVDTWAQVFTPDTSASACFPRPIARAYAVSGCLLTGSTRYTTQIVKNEQLAD